MREGGQFFPSPRLQTSHGQRMAGKLIVLAMISTSDLVTSKLRTKLAYKDQARDILQVIRKLSSDTDVNIQSFHIYNSTILDSIPQKAISMDIHVWGGGSTEFVFLMF